MQLSIVKKIAIGNAGQIIGIVALFFAFWSTNNSLLDLQLQVNETSTYGVAMTEKLATDIGASLETFKNQITNGAAAQELENTHNQIQQQIVNFQETFESEQSRDALEISTVINGVISLGLITMIVRAVWQLLVLAYFMLIARFTLERPLNRIIHAADQLAKDDLEVIIPDTKRQDEIGEMARADDVFKANAIEAQKLRQERETEQIEIQVEREARQEKELAQRDADQVRKETEQKETQKEIKGNMLEMSDSLDDEVQTTVNAVVTKSDEMAETTNSMISNMEKIIESTDQVSNAAKTAAGNVNDAATAANELSESVSNVGEQVVRSREVAQQGVRVAHRTSEMVEGLDLATDKIGEVVSLINDIAEQTNLLALNATIEAARAEKREKVFLWWRQKSKI